MTTLTVTGQILPSPPPPPSGAPLLPVIEIAPDSQQEAAGWMNAGKLGQAQWVRVQGPGDNDAVDTPGFVTACWAAGVKYILLYELECYGGYGAPDNTVLRNSQYPNGVPSGDGYTVYCGVDPAFQTVWNQYGTSVTASHGLTIGRWVDSPSINAFSGYDNNGYTQHGTDVEAVGFYQTMRTYIPHGYVVLNLLGSPGSYSVPPYCDDIVSEFPFSVSGDYGVTHNYDGSYCNSLMSALYDFAFNKSQNVTMYVEGGNFDATSDLFQAACGMLFVGHPWSDVHGTGAPSLVRFSILPGHYQGSFDGAYFTNILQTNFSSLGQPTAPPTNSNLVWTRPFQGGTLQINLANRNVTVF